MRYKVGDRVRVRQWKAMEREFGENENGNILINIMFTKYMAKYCGEVVTIKSILSDNYKIKEDNELFVWKDEMFEGYAFRYGDKIEVSDDGINWDEYIYIGYADGAEYPYIVADTEEFYSSKNFDIGYFVYARPIHKYKINIEDKEIRVPKDVYDKIKEIIL